ncbi:MAG: Na+/H+ antiporter subunit E [Gammaproteobacteria bacterium]
MAGTHKAARPDTAPLFRRALLLVAALAFWLLIAWPVSPFGKGVLWGDVAAGVLAAAVVALVMRELVAARLRRLLEPARYGWAIVFLAVFAWHVIRGNLDVAYRVLHPAMPIRPGIVKATTRLSSAAARTLLANAITLTPGTLTVDIVGNDFYIHCINVDAEDEAAFAGRILARFEDLVARVLE